MGVGRGRDGEMAASACWAAAFVQLPAVLHRSALIKRRTRYPTIRPGPGGTIHLVFHTSDRSASRSRGLWGQVSKRFFSCGAVGICD